MARQIVMYGILGKREGHKVISYAVINRENEDRLIDEIAQKCEYLLEQRPAITQIYVLDNSGSITRWFKQAHSSNQMSDWLNFKTILDQYGLELNISRYR